MEQNAQSHCESTTVWDSRDEKLHHMRRCKTGTCRASLKRNRLKHSLVTTSPGRGRQPQRGRKDVKRNTTLVCPHKTKALSEARSQLVPAFRGKKENIAKCPAPSKIYAVTFTPGLAEKENAILAQRRQTESSSYHARTVNKARLLKLRRATHRRQVTRGSLES